jgi:hypothetical protein
MLKGIYISLAGLFDEIPIENLPTILLVLKPLGPNLDSMA